jgi:hypothetical protein
MMPAITGTAPSTAATAADAARCASSPLSVCPRRQIPFPVGYGVETSHLIDVYHRWGMSAFAQTDLDCRIHTNQSTDALGRMAFGILQTFLQRIDSPEIIRDLPERHPEPVHGRPGPLRGVGPRDPGAEAFADDRDPRLPHLRLPVASPKNRNEMRFIANIEGVSYRCHQST